jgi:hypothetical protein
LQAPAVAELWRGKSARQAGDSVAARRQTAAIISNFCGTDRPLEQHIRGFVCFSRSTIIETAISTIVPFTQRPVFRVYFRSRSMTRGAHHPSLNTSSNFEQRPA